MKRFWTAVLTPPVGACRYGCGSHCAAPITVFWLFGLVSVVFGLFGGPTGQTGISWYTIGLGLAMWGISATWTLFTIRGFGTGADRCYSAWSLDESKTSIGEENTDPTEQAR